MGNLCVGLVDLGWTGETNLKSYLQLPNVETITLTGRGLQD